MTERHHAAGPDSTFGRHLRWLKWAMAVAWLGIALLTLLPAGRLGQAENNSDFAALPKGAESTQVAQLEKSAGQPAPVPVTVVYHRDGGLTPADGQTISADRARIASAHVPHASPAGPVNRAPSDASTAAFTVPMADEPGQPLPESVAEIRTLVHSDDPGLEVAVTGVPAIIHDTDEIFDGIDTTLLYATLAVVVVLLLLTYRSPVLWLLPVVSVGLGLQVAKAGAYAFARGGGTVTGLAAGILTVLAFGAGTDYALLLISRYREELRRRADRHDALAEALRRTTPAIVASGATVIAAMLCLLAATFGSTRGLGPVLALGIVGALAAMLTLLPALLAILGRWVFWPVVPQPGPASREPTGAWARFATGVARHPRRNWVMCTVLLLGLAGGLAGTAVNLSPLNQFTHTPESIRGQELIAQAFPAGSTVPTTVVAPAGEVEAAQRTANATPGVAVVRPQTTVLGEYREFQVVLASGPYSDEAYATVDTLRSTLAGVAPHAMVGGNTAVQLDVRHAAARDDAVIAPLVLGVIFVILGLLLRSVVAPAVLVTSVIVSFAGAFGVSTLAFRWFGFAGISPQIPLFAFIFLVALGVDYNIFLMHRARLEARVAGTRAGMARALTVTGSVITSAGLVLAGTFAVLAVLPLVQLAEVGFAVAFGVLLDTFLVRSVLVPAVVLDLERRIWWPSRPASVLVPAPARVIKVDA
jgi:RND superfamily putative drug exporter